MTTVKTYDAATFRRAKREWDEGGFGPAWDEARRLSWERGYLLPPTGSPVDQREDEFDGPSQRSIVWRALDYRPAGTLAIIASSRSWGEVVARIFGDEERLQERADAAEREHDEERRRWPTRTQAAGILRQLEQRTGTRL